ncbi:RNA 2',3'-cyclic phosphodiesterase [Streptomyces antnestii]|uniref:RNA 2',3'-cyclic phosphodiesterase n=1 Tax=Streptomyces antnestii TaxID=2494256 RepID=A0A437PGK4_9ACTN|nr:RNA 2',3'-cyclic phosphodiesterase [Streptomyces sp. San01]RVU21411.1 RNA 2',3'-cyclic phosphodiesterase [Streptomyces sp. San01]
MRLFAAVLPPERALSELAGEVDQLQNVPGARRLRWTGRPGWHYTLAFYGEVADDLVPELSERLERAAHKTPPFELAIGGGGRFDGQVLWVGATGDLDTLAHLAHRAEAAARRAGVEMKEHRRYHPHLTVARGRDHADLRPFVDVLHEFSGSTWTVGELGLVRSNLPRSGVAGEQPRYEKVAGWPLGAAG